VPDEVAVIGVDNDEFLCNLTDPPLTSVAPDTRRTGYEAAALLDRLMAGSYGLCSKCGAKADLKVIEFGWRRNLCS